jgi:hypothetical protein
LSDKWKKNYLFIPFYLWGSCVGNYGDIWWGEFDERGGRNIRLPFWGEGVVENIMDNWGR